MKHYWHFVHTYWRDTVTEFKALSQFLPACHEWATIASSSFETFELLTKKLCKV